MQINKSQKWRLFKAARYAYWCFTKRKPNRVDTTLFSNRFKKQEHEIFNQPIQQ